MSDSTSTPISFANDIIPIFYQYRNQMMWRFDLTNYGDVKTNYDQILSHITDPDDPMPPPPFPRISTADIDTFKAWKTDGFLP